MGDAGIGWGRKGAGEVTAGRPAGVSPETVQKRLSSAQESFLNVVSGDRGGFTYKHMSEKHRHTGQERWER